MNRHGLQKRIDALNDKYLIGYDSITRIERQIMVPGLRVEGEPNNPIPTGEVVVHELKKWRL